MTKNILLLRLPLLGGTSCQSLGKEEAESTDKVVLVDQSRVQQKVALLDSVARKETQAIGLLGQNVLRTRGTVMSEESLTPEELDKVQTSLTKLTEASKTVLFELGLNESDLKEIFGSADDSRIALLGLVLLDAHRQGQTTRSIEWDDVVDCAGEVLGMSALRELHGAFGAGQKLTQVALRQVLKKAAVKVASRLMGSVGAGLAVAEFGLCLYRAD